MSDLETDLETNLETVCLSHAYKQTTSADLASNGRLAHGCAPTISAGAQIAMRVGLT